ncbi:MAG: glycosyltransferase [Phycisphaerae bacterium]|nr:glycosyltransferase [Phycisphaerae bacterium]
MRLVHVIEGMHPDRGGPPVVCAALAAAQARLGHDVTIVCEGEGSQADASDALVRSMRGGDLVHVERVAQQTLLKALFSDLGERSSALRATFDLLHLHGIWNPIVLAASRAARRARSPYLVSSHGALHPDCMTEKRARKQLALALGWRGMLRDARRVLCLNDEEARETDRIVSARVAMVLPNGVDVASLPASAPNAFRESMPALGDRPYFVFVGRLDHVKGLDLLLDAYAAYRTLGGGADLVLVGPDWGERASIEVAAACSPLLGHVHLAGALYDNRKFAALREALAFVHRPRYEGFGLAVVESMAVGTPAVISHRCLLPVQGEDDGVVVVADEAGEFAAALHRFDRDVSLRSTLSIQALACVRRRFDWTLIAQSTLEAAGAVEAE